MSSGRGGTKQYESAEDQVEELLRATEDDIALLNLSLPSHVSSTASSSSHVIHPDLDRRFQALRSSSSSSNSNSKLPSSTANTSSGNKATAAVVDDDLFARFAALKSTIPSYSNKNRNLEITDHDSGDEVDEVIRWAIDAAALDPSPPSDDDVTDDSSDDQTDDDEDDDDDPKQKQKEKKNKKTNGGRK